MKKSPIATVLPYWSGFLVGQLPRSLLDHLLSRLSAAIKLNHPELIGRMGGNATAIFLIDPQDAPFALRMQPSGKNPLTAVCRENAGKWDARISGTVAALLSMIHGEQDGDALFFSGDITIEGDTSAILALRNAIDAVEIDLLFEFATLLGPFRFVAERSLRGLLPAIECLIGDIKLTRQDRAAI